MHTMEEKKKSKRGNIFYIGLLSFFGGISQDIFLPILPLYLSSVVGLNKEFIGLAEGLVSSAASIFKIVAGYLTDKLKRRKPFIFIGYFLSLLGRVFLAISSSAFGVIALRFLDGIGKGVKDSPKSALAADSAKLEERGKSFGIIRMLDTLGSVAGPLLLFVILYFLGDSPFQYHYVLIATAIPLVATLSIISFKLKETAIITETNQASKAPAKKLPKRFFIFLGISLLFTLGNSSDAFLILRAQNLGVTLLAIPIVYAVFNFVYAMLSVVFGGLSDKIGREKIIIVGWLVYALSYFGFGAATLQYHIWLLFAFYGLYYAMTQGVGQAYIADLVVPEYRGRAYGIYNTAIGVAALPASFIAGLLWDKFGPQIPFYFGGIIAVIATILFFAYYLQNKGSSQQAARY